MNDTPRTDTAPVGIETPPATTTPAGTGDSGHIDPEHFYALQQEVARYEALVNRLNPHADRIKLLDEDPEAARLFDDSWAAYQQMRERNKPQVDESVRPIYEKVSKLEQFVDKFEQREREAIEAPQREAAQKWNEWQNSSANNRFYQRLVTEHELKPRDLQYLAQVAAEQNYAPLEDVWKQESWRFTKAAASAPPTSLRSDSGEIGIPGASTARTEQSSMRDRIIELERHRRGA